MNTSRAPTDDDADRELSELEKSKEVLPNFYSLMEKVNRVANGLPRAKLNPLDHTDFEMDVPEPGLDDDAEMDSDSDDGVLANCTIELLATVAKLPQSAYDAPHLLHESYGLPPNPEEPDEVIDISSGDEDDNGEEAAAKEEDAEKPIILLHDDGDAIQTSASSGTASTDGDIQILRESTSTSRDTRIPDGNGRSATTGGGEADDEIECLGPYKFEKKEETNDNTSERSGGSVILID